MEAEQPGSAAISSGRMGTDDTTLIERVEPSSCVAAGDRLPVHLQFNNYCVSWRYADSRTKFQCSCSGLRETQLPLKGKLNT